MAKPKDYHFIRRTRGLHFQIYSVNLGIKVEEINIHTLNKSHELSGTPITQLNPTNKHGQKIQ